MTGSHRGLDAASYLAHVIASGGVVPDLDPAVVLALTPAARPRRARSLGGPFGAAERDRTGVVSVSPVGPGPAVAAMTIELAAACGVRDLVAIGTAGSFDRTHDGAPDAGTHLVVEASRSDESVSRRYGGCCHADPGLTGELARRLGADRTVAWTTAAPFRLDLDAVDASGASVIEMEAAALFAAGASTGVRVGLVVVVSDATTAAGWVGHDAVVVRRAVEGAAAACRELVGRLR